LTELEKDPTFETTQNSPIQIHNQQWWQKIATWRETNCLAFDSSSTSIKPQQVIDSLYRVTNGDIFITSDVGQHQMFAALHYPFKRPKQWISSGGLGTMGFGLPFAS